MKIITHNLNNNNNSSSPSTPHTMAKKRSADEAGEDDGAAETTTTTRTTRGSKSAKVDSSPSSKTAKKDKAPPKPRGKGKSVAPSLAKFKEEALPLHVHITHTPPTVSEAAPDANATEPSTSTDPGHVASISCQPTEFNTKSYGWKGSRRVNIELVNAETGEKETVAVMINVNATVVGSKDNAKAEEKEQEKEKEPVAEKERDELKED